MGFIYNNSIVFSSIHNLGLYLGYEYDEFENVVIHSEGLLEFDEEEGTLSFCTDKATEKWFNQFGLSNVRIIASGEVEAVLL